MGCKVLFPTDCLFDKSIDLKEESFETLYSKLLKDNEQYKDMEAFSDISGDILDVTQQDGASKLGESLLTHEQAQQEADEQLRKFEVMNMLKNKDSSSSASSNLERNVKELLKPRYNWKRILKQYCNKLCEYDISYKNPDKRFFYNEGCIYPGKSAQMSESLGNIKICIDTSGSISDREVEHFVSEVNSILLSFRLTGEIICWNTEISGVCKLEKASDLVAFKAVGTGGTTPEVLFKHFDKLKKSEKPEIILIFTDGFIKGFNDDELSKWEKRYRKTLWITTETGKKSLERIINPKVWKICVNNRD